MVRAIYQGMEILSSGLYKYKILYRGRQYAYFSKINEFPDLKEGSRINCIRSYSLGNEVQLKIIKG